ncbi:Small G protein signaling modulator 3 [Cichlidogyrus casuarinus]|uniref:Small G protein signaling modulator 3 n=1 Tax=Cichlidogyrus casuarinus TaxID=1844966 RepID=A0ABD2PXS7_9PLAT
MICSLAGALLRVFQHGMKKTKHEIACNPWSFIEEAVAKEMEKDFSSVYSRLVLCKTFHLDHDGRVLGPEELLFRSVQMINKSSAPQEQKFRTLVCMGLNEQVLHMWLEVLHSSQNVLEKWYHPWAFIRTPVWLQIKCELRLLIQFSFHLSTALEADTSPKKHQLSKKKTLKPSPSKPQNGSPPGRTLSTAVEQLTADDSSIGNVSNCIDMIVKHHLFSWEL